MACESAMAQGARKSHANDKVKPLLNHGAAFRQFLSHAINGRTPESIARSANDTTSFAFDALALKHGNPTKDPVIGIIGDWGTTDEKREMSKPKTERYASVWDAIADTPEEAANLRVRAELMDKITAIIEESGWTQAEAADHCGVTQPRISDLLRGRISRFSLDALVNIASALGKRVQVRLMAA